MSWRVRLPKRHRMADHAPCECARDERTQRGRELDWTGLDWTGQEWLHRGRGWPLLTQQVPATWDESALDFLQRPGEVGGVGAWPCVGVVVCQNAVLDRLPRHQVAIAPSSDRACGLPEYFCAYH